MLSLLLEPTMFILKRHIALSGMIMTNNKLIESPGLDIEANLSKLGSGKDSLGILYSRKRLEKTGRAVNFQFYDNNDTSRTVTRKGFQCSIPFDISIVTNQLTSLDYLEIIHRMYLTLQTYGFNVEIPSIAGQVEKIPYGLYYSDVNDKSDNPVSGPLKDGFRYYNFSISVNGFLLAPYVESANLVSNVDFTITPYDGSIIKVGELTEDNSVSLYIPRG
jgi:hypothetical protein